MKTKNRISVVENFDIDLAALLKEYESNIPGLLKDTYGWQKVVLVQKKFHIKLDGEENEVLKSMPYTKSVADRVFNVFQFNDMSYRVVMPLTAYGWHIDYGMTCYHIPLITNSGCRFVYEDENYKMNTGKLYSVHNGIFHTFVNSGTEPRVHITFENLAPKEDRVYD